MIIISIRIATMQQEILVNDHINYNVNISDEFKLL